MTVQESPVMEEEHSMQKEHSGPEMWAAVRRAAGVQWVRETPGAMRSEAEQQVTWKFVCVCHRLCFLVLEKIPLVVMK